MYQLHSSPPYLGLYSEELGYSEIYLGDLNLSEKEIDALAAAKEVTGTYELRKMPKDIYVPLMPSQVKSTWAVKTLKPA